LSSLLPLFPLDVVLLPGSPLPLHIFEPRYREMIGECLKNQAPFGVVRAKENNIETVGCTAEIVSVPKRYDDGRLDIVTRGVERFEIVETNQERSFLQARVNFLHDDVTSPTGDEMAKAYELHREILALAGAEAEPFAEIDDGLFSFHLAGSLPLDLDFKQSLLSMDSEAERVHAMIEFFSSVLPNLRHSVHIRHKAGGNGHAR
jgi:Lon protease-like protein